MSKYSNDEYSYLDIEDRAFAQAFRLSEDEFLTLCGGLKNYTEYRLLRKQARASKMADGTPYNVPPLPTSIVPFIQEQVGLPPIDEHQLAEVILKEHLDKVRSIDDALLAGRRLEEWEKQRAEEKQRSKERGIAALQRESAKLYGWKEDSQSAKDWAAAEYERRNRLWIY